MVFYGRCLWRWACFVLAIQTHATVAATEQNAVMRLGVKRVQRNGEIDRLVANYETNQQQNELSTTRSSLTSVFRNLLAEAVARVGWYDAGVLTTRPAPMPMTMTASAPPILEAVETRIRSGGGSHTITVLVGGQERELIIDTGSGKTAFICDGCTACGHRHEHAPFHPTNNTKFVSCDHFHPGDAELGGCMACVGAKCRYGQKYVEGDYWEAYKMTDEMRFLAHDQSTGDTGLKATVAFGCIDTQTGCFNDQTSDGIMGFSRHPDAIFEQFFRQHATRSRIFAQCLAADGGTLTIGGVDMHLHTVPVAYTPLRDTGYQYWTVYLESISIGTVPLVVDSTVYNADRGCVLDSGTTFVYLPTATKAAFVAAWRRARGGSDDDLPLSDSYHRIDDSALQFLPSICFHFANAATLCMAPDAYMFQLASGQYAGTIFFGDQAHSTIVGASALMHHNIIYDVDNHRVGMAKANCNAAALGTSEIAATHMIALEVHPGGDTFRVALVDHTYWSQVALAAVAVIAMAGLVVTVWEEMSRPRTAAVPAAKGEQKRAIHEDDGVEFAFVLMPEDD